MPLCNLSFCVFTIAILWSSQRSADLSNSADTECGSTLMWPFFSPFQFHRLCAIIIIIVLFKIVCHFAIYLFVYLQFWKTVKEVLILKNSADTECDSTLMSSCIQSDNALAFFYLHVHLHRFFGRLESPKHFILQVIDISPNRMKRFGFSFLMLFKAWIYLGTSAKRRMTGKGIVKGFKQRHFTGRSDLTSFH